MSVIEKDIKKYIRNIRKKLLSDKKQKKAILNEIESSIYDYAENKGIKNIDEIYKHFGTPEEVARSYISQEKAEKLKSKLFTKKILIILSICILIIGIIIFLLLIDDYIVSSFPIYKHTFTFSKESASLS